MKFVLDTNVIFSALYDFESPAGKLLAMAIEKKVELASPVHVKEELVKILREKLEYTHDEIRETIAALPVAWVEEDIYVHTIKEAKEAISHEEDAPVVACAMALECDVISGDKHFHTLRKPVIKVWRLKSLKKFTTRKFSKNF